MTHLGTFTGINYRPHCAQPQRSMAHALISGVVMAGFLFAATVWLGSI